MPEVTEIDVKKTIQESAFALIKAARELNRLGAWDTVAGELPGPTTKEFVVDGYATFALVTHNDRTELKVEITND